MTQRLVLLLVLLLPAVGLPWVQGRLLMEARQQTIAGHRDDLEMMVGHIVRLSLPSTFVEDRGGRIRRALAWGEDPTPWLDEDGKRIFRAYLFDRRGRRLQHPGCEPDKVRISERFLELWRDLTRDRRKALSGTEEKMVESFLGASRALDMLVTSPGRMNSLEELTLPLAFGLFPVRSRIGGEFRILLLVADKGRLRTERLAGKAMASVQRKAGSRFRFGVIDLQGQQADLPSRWPRSWRRQVCRDRIVGTFVAGGRQFATKSLERRFLVFGSRILPRLPSPMPGLGVALCLAAGLFLFIGFVPCPAPPIRFLVIGLFGLAGLAGALTLLGLASVYRDTRREAMVHDRVRKATDLLEKLDAGFHGYLERLSLRLQKETRRLGEAWNDERLLPGRIATLRGLSKIASVSLVHRAGLIRLRLGRSPLWKAVFGRDDEREISRVAEIAVRLSEKGPGHEEEIEGEGMGSSMALWLARFLIRTHGQVHVHQFGSLSPFLFNAPIYDPGGSIVGFQLILFKQGGLEKAYLNSIRRHLRTAAESLEFPVHLVALPKAGRESQIPSVGPLPFPDLLDLHLRVSQTGSPGWRSGRWKQHPVLMTAVPGQALVDHQLFLVTPLEPVLRASRRLTLGFFALAAGLLLYGIGLGWQFIAVVLRPIRELSRGMEAMVASRFSTVLTLSTADEFEEIGNGLNEVFAEMKDRAFAGSIQEALLPPVALAGDDWTCQGWTRAASDIGGEIFDHQWVEEGAGQGRVLLWIVRVPGHALGSALVLAMTKMALRLLGSEPDRLPAAILREWLEQFPSQREVLRQSTLFLGMYKPSSGVLEWASQGEFLLWGGEGPPGFLEEWGGTRGRQPGSTLATGTGSWRLVPGQRLIICSEGCWGGDPARREHLTARGLPSLVPPPGQPWPAPLGPRLFAHLREGAGSVSVEESQTVLLLERGPDGAAHNTCLRAPAGKENPEELPTGRPPGDARPGEGAAGTACGRNTPEGTPGRGGVA